MVPQVIRHLGSRCTTTSPEIALCRRPAVHDIHVQGKQVTQTGAFYGRPSQACRRWRIAAWAWTKGTR